MRRAPTRANSAATKKALASTRTTTATKPSSIGGDSAGSIRPKSSQAAATLRGRHLIRRLTVPPFESLEAFLPRLSVADAATREAVRGILDRVMVRGDAAVQEYTRQFDGVDIGPREWELETGVWHDALGRISVELRDALARAVQRVTEYHQRQREEGFHLADPDGTVVGMKVAPLDRVGLYVPGGKASYPSTVVMNAVPALVAGVQEIVAVVPPQGVTDVVLAACALSGVTRVFRVGGAQAIAALAYGTRTIPRVDKIVGPGNRWVAEAKRQVVGLVGIDMIAGPTELLILADGTARADRIALDLIAQAEHDEDASSWCVTTDADLAEALPRVLDDALNRNPRAAIARAALERNGLIVVAGSMRDAIEVVNRRAPEHVEIIAEGTERVASAIRNAGAIFLGDDTPEPVGDYLAGPSHVLPTGGTARYASPLGVYDYVKRTSVIRYAPARLAEDAAAIIALAEAEGLYGHAEAVRSRIGGGAAAGQRGSGK
ncbi:MAG TPA: histidinol dehydrogenase [Gemmatimonadales bacterium]|nr:histidinol dehydrogenase [Gemmatimonadales bacterium]